MEKFESAFLKDKYWSKPEFRQATEAAARRTEQRTGEKVPHEPPERIANYLDRFSQITDRQDPTERAQGLAAIERLVEKKYVIKPENISDDYIKSVLLGNEAELLGYEREDVKYEQVRQTVLASLENKIHSSLDTYTVPTELRESLEQMLITDQQSRMKQWLDYLTGEEARHAPAALRYWAFAEMLKQGDYDPVRKAYNERTSTTVANFPELDQQALALVFDEVARRRTGKPSALATQDQARQAEFRQLLQSENFGKLYAFMQEHVRSLKLPTERLAVTAGEWRVFPQGSSAQALTAPLQGFQTKWCIAGAGHAASYLAESDMHIYFSQDAEGQNAIPRACIVDNKERGITEVRGIIFNEEVKQHLDDYITPVVDDKLKQLPGGEKWADRMEDMKKLRELHFKHLQTEPFTKDDLVFLYELDHTIASSGYGRDPRIKELRQGRDIMQDIRTIYGYNFEQPTKPELEFIYDVGSLPAPVVFKEVRDNLRATRNPEADMPIVFECAPEQIAHTLKDINPNTKAYVGPLEPGIFDLIKEHNIEHIYTSFPEGKIRQYQIEIGGKDKNQLEQELKDKNIYVPDYAKDLLNSPDFTTLIKSEQTDLVRLTVKDLGFPQGATTDEIYQKAQKLGLELCPAEVGPNLRLQYPGKEWILIAMKQIADHTGCPDVFDLRAGGGNLKLGASNARPDFRRDAENRFVFRRGK